MDKDTGSTHSLSKRKRYQSTMLVSLSKQEVIWQGPKKSHAMKNGEEIGYLVKLNWYRDQRKYYTFPKLIREREEDNICCSTVLGISHILCNFSQWLSKACIIIPIIWIGKHLHNFPLDHTQILDGRARITIFSNFITKKIMYHVPWAFYLPKPFILMNHAIPNQLTRKFLNSSRRIQKLLFQA